MFYTVRRSSYRYGTGYGYYYPAFKRSARDTWHLYQQDGQPLACTTYARAYEYLREKNNHNDARLYALYVN